VDVQNGNGPMMMLSIRDSSTGFYTDFRLILIWAPLLPDLRTAFAVLALRFLQVAALVICCHLCSTRRAV
jgi:hypothetical protein